MKHELKTWPKYFSRIVEGSKTFEVRKNDRDFQVGDELVLMEFDPENNIYTGKSHKVTVSYILHGGDFGVKEGFVVMGFAGYYMK